MLALLPEPCREEEHKEASPAARARRVVATATSRVILLSSIKRCRCSARERWRTPLSPATYLSISAWRVAIWRGRVERLDVI